MKDRLGRRGPHGGPGTRAGTVVLALTFVALTVVSSLAVQAVGGNAGGKASGLVSAAPSAVAGYSFPTPIQHVVVLLDENQNYAAVLAQGQYERYLAQTYGAATNDYSIRHGSIPAYEAAISADASHNYPNDVTTTLGDLLVSAGLTWSAFEENMTSPCNLTQAWSIGYMFTHNPPALFSEYRNNPAVCAQHDLTLTDWNNSVASGSIPTYSFITPNIWHDDHNASIAAGDAWLKSWLSPLINNSKIFSNTAFLISYDENGQNENLTPNTNGTTGGQVYTVVVSPYSKGLTSDHFYTTYSLLTTAEWLLGIPGGSLGTNDSWSVNPPMTDLFSFPSGSTYDISFTQSSLPSKTSWSVTLAGSTKSSRSSTITFREPDGTYPFTVGSVAGYTASPSSGSISVQGASVTQNVAFREVRYDLTFGESGLPAGTPWSVTLAGAANSSTGSVVGFSEPNGSYAFTVGGAPGYAPSPSSGTVTVNGGSVELGVIYSQVTYNVTFDETGLPLGTNWSTTLSGTTRSTTGSGIAFREPNGTYPYTIGSVAGFTAAPATGSVVVAGSATSPSIVFTAVPYNVTFTQSGLPAGTRWSVTLAGATQSSTGTTLTFSDPNGTYSYSVGGVAGYSAPSSGSVTIRGSPVQRSIPFTQVTYRVTVSETGLPAGTGWAVTLAGSTRNATGTALAFSEPNGTFVYTVGPVAGYTPALSSGSVTVNGSAVSQSVAFSQVTYTVSFTTTNLPAGSSWSVTLNGATQSSTGSLITFQEPNGTYAYSAGSPDGYTASSSSFSVAGGPATEKVSFSQVTYALTFSEDGLSPGANWSVTLTGGTSTTIVGAASSAGSAAVTRWSDGASSVRFLASNGSYAYLASAPGYENVVGTLTVHGGGLAPLALNFSPNPSHGSAPFLSYVLVAILVVDAVLAAGVVMLIRRRRARKRPPVREHR